MVDIGLTMPSRWQPAHLAHVWYASGCWQATVLSSYNELSIANRKPKK